MPVVLIPVSILGAFACLISPSWFDRYGILLCLASIVGMSSMFLAMQAGSALAQRRSTSRVRRRCYVSQHETAAHILAIAFTLFTAVLILNFAAHRISGGWPTGLEIADRLLGSRRR